MSNFLTGLWVGGLTLLAINGVYLYPSIAKEAQEQLIAACINDNIVIVNEVVYECDAQEIER